MKEDIKDIYNQFWLAQKKYDENGNIKEYNSRIQVLFKKYRDKPIQYRFCQNLLLSWEEPLEEIGGKKLRIRCEIDQDKFEKMLLERRESHG